MFEQLVRFISSGIIAFSQLVVSDVDYTSPWFNQIQVLQKAGYLRCSTRLENSFTQDLEKILLSGEPLTIHFTLELLIDKAKQPLVRKELIHRIQYALLEERYDLILTERKKPLRFFQRQPALDVWRSITEVPVISLEEMEPGHNYRVRVKAYLEDVPLPRLGRKIEAMNFWQRLRPAKTSPVFQLEPEQL